MLPSIVAALAVPVAHPRRVGVSRCNRSRPRGVMIVERAATAASSERRTVPPDELQESFDDFYRATSRRLVHQMYAITGSSTEAQDCVHEAYARAWQRWSKVRTYAEPEAWVRTVARRVAVSRWRRARTAVLHLRRQGAEPTSDAPSEDHTVLVAALRKITAEQREAIVLHHLSGLSVQEVADETGVAVGTVKARLHRGRAALAAVIGDLDAPQPVHPADPSLTEEAHRGR